MTKIEAPTWTSELIDGRGDRLVPHGLYYIFRPSFADMAMWWRPNSAGYTCVLEEAGEWRGDELPQLDFSSLPLPVGWVRERARRFVPANGTGIVDSINPQMVAWIEGMKIAKMLDLKPGEHCTRCHRAAPNPNGCAICNVPRLQARVMEGELAAGALRSLIDLVRAVADHEEQNNGKTDLPVWERLRALCDAVTPAAVKRG